jgi:photosystem II stability/assembly factor-like uncharacterized protein
LTNPGLPVTAVGAYRSMFWCNEYQGFLVHNSAGVVGTVYRTLNGGTTWEALTTPANLGLNSIWAASPRLAFVAGNVAAAPATGCILKIEAAYV